MQLQNTFLISIVELLLDLLCMKFELLFDSNMASDIIFQLLELFLVCFGNKFVFLFRARSLHLVNHLFELLAESAVFYADQFWLR
jgi:hypothetical protein